MNKMEEVILKKVLFITDDCDYEKEYTIKNNDSEGNKPFARDEMVHTLNKYFKDVYTTYSVLDAAEYIRNNRDIFVVTTYYGKAEPDSKSIIPALCKVYGVKYLGADSYAQMICNDKHLSKSYIRKYGLNQIPGVIIYSPNNINELNELDNLNYPVIVKPNFGGGSNGIINNSITYNKSQTIKLIKELYLYQNIPIIVEEYIPGYEVSFIIIGDKEKILFSGESELNIDNKNIFNNEVFGLESKKITPSRKKYCDSNHIDVVTQHKMFQLFHSFDKMEFMRIDCRIKENGDIYVLELSPDCYIGSNGAFQETLKRNGYNFNEMLKMLLNNSLSNQNN